MSYQKNNKDPRESDNNGNTSVVATLEKPKLKKPPLYRVILLNDDYTPMEFVVYVLQVFFGFYGRQSTTNYVSSAYPWQGSLWYLYQRGC